MEVVTCIAPVNIAVIKYWGKRDEDLILPLNDSISATLSTDQMHAKTTIMISSTFSEDKIWLNGKEESLGNPRYTRCLKEIRRKAINNHFQDWKVHICSENNFPTAAGLASSAAGFACLVYSLSKIFNVEEDISSIARLGSGSACRSVSGGFVQWLKGSKKDGSDSVAKQLVPSSHWPELRVLILVVNDVHKKVSSTVGMQRTAETSELLQHRITQCVPHRIFNMIKAIQEKNFQKFAELTMKDSNQFHSVCMDTYPPTFYMNMTSQHIIDFVHTYNKLSGENKVAYTFDAGPNACLFLQESSVAEVLHLIQQTFPPKENNAEYIRGIPITIGTTNNEGLMQNFNHYETGLLKYIIYTKLGEGPQELKGDHIHLLNANGMPKSNS